MPQFDIETVETWIHDVSYRDVRAVHRTVEALELVRSGRIDYDDESVRDDPGKLLQVSDIRMAGTATQPPGDSGELRRVLTVTRAELQLLRDLVQERLDKYARGSSLGPTDNPGVVERLQTQLERLR